MSLLHLLVIEDDPIDAEAFRRALEACRPAPRLHLAADMPTGLASLRGLLAAGCDRLLVVLDIDLPGGDGHQFLQRRAQEETLRLVPVVVLSSSTALADRRRAFAAGAAGYFIKPLAAGELHGLLDCICSYWSASVLGDAAALVEGSGAIDDD